MKVYREVGFNPLGCLWPLLIQMPIWIALFQVLRRTVGDTPEQLLALSTDLYDWSYITSTIPIDRDFLFLDLGSSALAQALPLAILVGATAFIQQKVSTARTTVRDERQESMARTMLWMMPIMFGFFTLSVPAGLGLYWLVTSIFTIATSWWYYFYRPGVPWSWRWLLSAEPLPAPASAAVDSHVAAGANAAVASDRPADRASTRDTTDATDTDDSTDPDPDAAQRSRRSTSGAARRRRRRRRAGRTS